MERMKSTVITQPFFILMLSLILIHFQLIFAVDSPANLPDIFSGKTPVEFRFIRYSENPEGVIRKLLNEKCPNSSFLLVKLGDYYSSVTNDKLSLKIYQKAVKEGKSFGENLTYYKAYALYQIADLLKKKDQIEDALANLDGSIAYLKFVTNHLADPLKSYPYYLKGEIFFNKGNLKESINNYSNAFQIFSSAASPYDWVNYSVCNKNDARFSQSILNEAENFYPNSPEILLSQAKMHLDTDQLEESLDYLQFSFLIGRGTNQQNNIYYQNLLLALIATSGKDAKENPKFYKKSYDYIYYMLQSLDKQNKNNLKDALKLTQRASDLVPQSPYVNYRLGLLENRLENYNSALFHLLKSNQKKPSLAVVHAELAMVYIKLNQIEPFKKNAELALKLDPDSLYIATNLRPLMKQAGE